MIIGQGVGRLPKLTNNSNLSENKSMLPSLTGVGGGAVGNGSKVVEKDSQKMKEISKAYKVNLAHLDELKERYRQLKKLENQSGGKQQRESKHQGAPSSSQHHSNNVNIASSGNNVLKNQSVPYNPLQGSEAKPYYNYSAVDAEGNQ